MNQLVMMLKQIQKNGRLNCTYGKSCTKRLGLLFACICAIVSVCFVEPALGQAQADEYQVKAAFLFHFAQLVDWPSSAFTANNNALVLCTYGDDPFHGELEKMIQGKQIGSRSIQVKHLKQTEDVHSCQIVFVSKGVSKYVPALLTNVGDAPIMTIGETGNFVEYGGVIGFCMDEDKIRFEVNLQSAERSKLKISSRLLLLAKTVVGSSEQR